ncbi:MAG: hypothetical protein FWD23_00140 [Oscillospiraceae bacterium]|nr:hypothetical protein [Oscillospiraceae bacterium]
MRKKTAIKRVLSFAIIAVMLFGALNFAVSAANPIVIDFSKYDSVTDILDSASGGQGEFAIKEDGTRFVLFAECVDGYDPADDPEGTGTKGDLYSTVKGFADLGVNADTYKWMKMSVRNESAAPGFEIHFSSPTKGLSVETSITFDIKPNSGYTSYIYDVTEACKKYYPKRPADVENPDVYPDHWKGLIDVFRLDFMYYDESGGHAKTGDKIYIEYIAFFESEQAAKDFVFVPSKGESPTEAPAAEGNGDAGDSNTGGDSESGDNNMMLIIIIAAAAVVVIIIVVVVIISAGKKKKKD